MACGATESGDEIAKQAADTELPDDLLERVEELLKEEPELSWDAGVAKVLV